MEERHIPLLAILISGRGSNMTALIDACAAGRVRARVAVVISNRRDAAGLVRAEAAGIETIVMDHRGHASREAYDRALAAALSARGVSLICLAGFMRLVGPAFCNAFPNAILNVHPSLLPAFPGIDAQAQALRHGVKVSGATVHLVTPELDAGPIVVQQSVPVLDGDTVATLSERILAVEHEIYPRAAQSILEGRWRIDGRRVLAADATGAADASRSPGR